jgi:hypothetical protein
MLCPGSHHELAEPMGLRTVRAAQIFLFAFARSIFDCGKPPPTDRQTEEWVVQGFCGR